MKTSSRHLAGFALRVTFPLALCGCTASHDVGKPAAAAATSAAAAASSGSIAAAASPVTAAARGVIADANADALAHGKVLFQHAWTPHDVLSNGGDGLGPNYNGSSCMGCHNMGGEGGGGGTQGNTQIVDGKMVPHHNYQGEDRKREMLRSFEERGADGDGPFILISADGSHAKGPLGKERRDRVLDDLLDLARPNVTRCFEGVAIKAHDGFRKFDVHFSVDKDGGISDDVTAKGLSPAQLACIHQELVINVRFPAEPAASTVTWSLFASSNDVRPMTQGQRNPTSLFGDGVINGIADATIVENAVYVPGHPEITGTVPRTQKGEVARFGWKGDVKDLDTFVSRACALEVGLDVPGMHQYGFDDANSKGLDLDAHDVTDLASFVKALPKPKKTESVEASRGSRIFASVGCTACHREKVGDVDGIYSDLLLHDMGPQLADGGGYGGGTVNANDREWRTPPLWGVRDSGPWLHDGRALSLIDAVKEHSGEASLVRAAFEELREDDQEAVVSFLESLQTI